LGPFSAPAGLKQGFSSQPPILKELHVKKIAIALVATATLALAACGENKAATDAQNLSDTANQASADMLNSANALEEQATNLGDAAQNAGAELTNAAAAATNEVTQ
jgi:hypothetical protein